MDDAQQRFHANRTVRADEVGWVSVDDLERWHGHERAFLKSATRGLQSPKFRRGWSFSEGHGPPGMVWWLVLLLLLTT